MRASSADHATIALARCPLQLDDGSFSNSHRPSSEGTFRVDAPECTPIYAVDRGLAWPRKSGCTRLAPGYGVAAQYSAPLRYRRTYGEYVSMVYGVVSRLAVSGPENRIVYSRARGAQFTSEPENRDGYLRHGRSRRADHGPQHFRQRASRDVRQPVQPHTRSGGRPPSRPGRRQGRATQPGRP